jgi:futalosine hydrolase
MSHKILYVTATLSEADTLAKIRGISYVNNIWKLGKTEISQLVTGVGSVAMAWSLKQWLSVNARPHLVINGGIAGSFMDDIKIGDVVMPVSDCFADSGIEDGDKFFTLFESGLADPDEFPYSSGIIHCDKGSSERMKDLLKPVNAITVNSATGSDTTVNRLRKKFNPDIETMEGATFFYLCAREKIPFLALRAISNRVETRNRGNWNIPLALECLSEKLKEVILRLE